MSRFCKDCAFFHWNATSAPEHWTDNPNYADRLEALGECRRHAPSIERYDGGREGGGPGFMRQWPAVFKNDEADWCGEFVPRSVPPEGE